MSSQQQLSRSETTVAAYRRAIERGAVDDLRPLLSTDVVLRSPLTDRVRFRGHDQVVAVAGAALGAIDGLRHVEETGDERVRLLVSAGTVDRVPIEETVVLRVDPARGRSARSRSPSARSRHSSGCCGRSGRGCCRPTAHRSRHDSSVPHRPVSPP